MSTKRKLIWDYFIQDLASSLKLWGFISFLLSLTSAGIYTCLGWEMPSVLLTLGVSILGLALLIFLWRLGSFVLKEFVQKRELRGMIKKPLPFDDYNFDKYSYIPIFGVIGIGDVGKTSLIEEILELDRTKDETRGKYVYIQDFLIDGEIKYIAFLDGTGQRNSIQMEIVRKVQHLIILIDHNLSATDIRFNPDRKDEHSFFLENVRDEIQNGKINIDKLFLLFNKEDLWKQNPLEVKEEINKYFKEEISKFRHTFPELKAQIFNTEENHYRKKFLEDIKRILS